MPVLTRPVLRATVRSVVRKADARGDIDAGRFTLKTAKQQIAKALGVEIEVLNATEWKQVVKDLVFEAIESIETLKSSPTKRVASPVTSEVAVLSRLMSDEERERRREAHRERGKAKVNKESRRKVHSSSESEGPSTTVPRRKKIKLDPDSESDRSDERDDPRGKPQTSKGHKAGRDSDGDERVDSEVDDPPRGKAKKREGRDGRPKKEGKKAADRKTVDKEAKSVTSTTTSTAPVIEDERVKELKSIVVACGVRKQWKREFLGMDTAEAQIAHLRRLLSDLGMRGQPTKGKAKVIKEKREMAAELGDVLEFEAKRGLGITRRGGQTEPAAPGSGRASRSPSPPARTSKARSRGARTNGAGASRSVASAAYVESSEEGTDSRSEDGSEGRGQSGDGSGGDDAGTAREQRRKMIVSSEDSDTE